MNLPTQPYKGARDFYPEDKRIQKYMFGKLRQVVESYGYQEYDAPILESFELYAAKSGEEIVNEQLYAFEDKKGRKVAIRPEMTPSVSRLVAARRQELAYPLRLYSLPNLWRYERPQAGRLREHWQLNVDIFGVDNISADFEVVSVAARILQSFGAHDDSYVIRINSRKLVDYLFREHFGLNDEQYYELSKLIDRWHKMPRQEFDAAAADILKDAAKQAELNQILETRSVDGLPETAQNHDSVQELRRLVELMAGSHINNAGFDFSIIRGMDYYNGIVFEVFDTDPDNTRSMFGGGRYDGLVALFGAEPVATVGFGMGDVTLQRFLEKHGLLPELKPETDLVAILIGDVYKAAQPALARLREAGVNLAVDSSGRKIDQQIKNAVKSGVKFALFIGEDELSSGNFKLRNLQQGTDLELPLEKVAETVTVH